jgi:ribosome maturation factor RimP
MGQKKFDAALRAEVAAIAESHGCELVQVDFARGVLQIILDKVDGGVTLDHCQKVSKEVSALLDVSDFGDQRYVLEVGSPGLDRELFSEKDYRRFVGSLVRVTFLGGTERQKKTIIGRMVDFAAEGPAGAAITVRTADSEQLIALRDIKKARLEIEL